jgi:hypothetical protein
VRQNRALAFIEFIQVLLDHPKREVVVTLDGENEAKTVHVCRRVGAVARWSAAGRYELSVLKETKLGGRKFRKLRGELRENLPNG